MPLTIAGVTRSMAFGEFLSQALAAFRADKVRATMTALGMVIGTSSLILVVTIALSGKQYVLAQIENIGTNLVWAEYEGLVNAGANASVRDYLTYDDMIAAEQQVPEIKAATPVLNLHERIGTGGGKEVDILILGVDPIYKDVRRMRVVAGRFFDEQDSELFSKVCLITQKFAETHYGDVDAALGRSIKIMGLPFVVVGVFRESMETFGRSEIQDDTILVPYTLARRLAGTLSINQIYFTMFNSDSVPLGTQEILRVIKSRHRPESEYQVDNLTDVLQVAERTANAFTLILLLFAVVTLIVGGVGIMNIMLATVSTRIREIGIRKAVGATRIEIEMQFLTEAVLISLVGGVIGTLLGLAVPFSLRLFTDVYVPIPFLAALIAILVSCSVGVIFGTLPARLAARLDPIESLRHE
ncbi:MAG: ABC transporter permease [Candidatus Korobacteraceae bacterium]